jgi:YebC/PmpR family DNA-binding regulatory protein
MVAAKAGLGRAPKASGSSLDMLRSVPLMSGHSKWATIKHKKGALDAKRGKLFTKLIKEITVAARMGGGDQGGNPRLRKAVSDAKGQAMPGETIKRAVQRGTGELEGAAYEEITYEGTGPGGTLFLVESMTDNRNRTVAEIRKIFEKNNGILGAAGTAGWAFERKGQVTLGKEVAEDQLMELAVGAGAEDYVDAGEEWQLTTPSDGLNGVLDALEKAHIKVKSSTLASVPKIKKPLAGRDAQVALNLAEALDDHDDVQNVYADFDVSDEELAALESAS